MKYTKYITGFLFALYIAGQTLFASGLYITPQQIDSGTNTVRLIVSNELEPYPTNAGINYLHIIKPTNLTLVPGSVVVSNAYDGTFNALTTVAFDSNWTFDNGNVMVSNSADDIYIWLGNQVTNQGDATLDEIYIYLDVAPEASFQEESFTAYIDAVMWDSMDNNPAGEAGIYATTGPQLCGGSAVLQQMLQPSEAYASITPGSIVQGGGHTFTYYVQATENSGHYDIEQLAIAIPTNFNTANFSNFNSIKLGTNTVSYLTIGTLAAYPGTNFILVDYSSSPIASPGGLDVISFEYIGSPTDP
ncbi:MAG TPA: hypothetical protein VKS21_06205, partial [Spirochaetota bacterium]|nr:hypothetical protein [Spirochaetota bacterium]